MPGKIRINTNGHAVAKMWSVYLDDVDISRFVRGIDISTVAGQLPQVRLGIVGHLELPDEMQALVTIYQEKELEDDQAN